MTSFCKAPGSAKNKGNCRVELCVDSHCSHLVAQFVDNRLGVLLRRGLATQVTGYRLALRDGPEDGLFNLGGMLVQVHVSEHHE